jgi:hypothetical protein
LYRDLILPEYLRQIGKEPEGPVTRDQIIAAADFWYERDPAMTARFMCEQVDVTAEPFIFEGLRVKGDVEYFVLNSKSTLFVVVAAKQHARAHRLLSAQDSIDDGLNLEKAFERIQFLDEHYSVAETLAYAKSRWNSVVIDTTGLNGQLADLSELEAAIKRLLGK